MIKEERVRLTIRVSSDLAERLRKRLFEEHSTMQEAGERCLENWVRGRRDDELDAFQRFRLRAPKGIMLAVKALIDYVNGTVKS